MSFYAYVNSVIWNAGNRTALAVIAIALVATGCEPHSVAGKAQSSAAAAALSARKIMNVTNIDRRQYAIGTVNGVRLKIPKYYLLHNIVYVGGQRDGRGPASQAVTQSSEIDNFGILLRLSNLEPITTERDREDWSAALSKPLFQKTWMMVSFDNHYPPPREGADKPAMIAHWGPYVLDKQYPYGLMHLASTQSADDGARGFYGHVEYYYDKATETTIQCNTRRIKASPFDTFETCDHQFLIRELHLMAEAFYTEKDLYRWRDIETKVNDIAHSFVEY